MSPQAILRRQGKRAMRQLIKRFGYTEDDFEIAERGEHDVLSGTPIYWWRCSHEYEEFDCTTALEQYRAVVAANKVDWAALMDADTRREKYRRMESGETK